MEEGGLNKLGYLSNAITEELNYHIVPEGKSSFEIPRDNAQTTEPPLSA